MEVQAINIAPLPVRSVRGKRGRIILLNDAKLSQLTPKIGARVASDLGQLPHGMLLFDPQRL